MARSRGRPSSDLSPRDDGDTVEALLRNGRGFSFFQAMRLLRRLVGGSGSSVDGGASQADAGPPQRIRMRANLSLAFPAADMDGVEEVRDPARDKPDYRITANFMGLYGPGSPLPTFYTEELLEEAQDGQSASRDFIDIFNQRIYDLLFQAWLKHRQALRVVEERDQAHLERLYCLLGLAEDTSYPRGAQRRGRVTTDYGLLRYIGLFTQYPRSAAGLTALLTDALEGVPLRILPCISRQAGIPESQRFRVGLRGNRLGANSYVGQAIEDRMGKFRIQIGPVDRARFLHFMPGGEARDKLTDLTAIYLTEPLACEVELILAPGEALTVCLGDPQRAQLGVSSWVFSQQSLGEVRTCFEMNR